MSKLTRFLSTAVAAIAFMLGTVTFSISPTQADTAPRCNSYANKAVSQQRKNIRNGCGYGGARWSNNWNRHYSWCRGVSSNAQRSETNQRSRLLNRCKGGGPEVRRYNKPRISGVRLDWCKYWGASCGRPAANAYCRRAGYDYASSYSRARKVGRWEDTKIITSGRRCSANYCDGFSYISCARH